MNAKEQVFMEKTCAGDEMRLGFSRNTEFTQNECIKMTAAGEFKGKKNTMLCGRASVHKQERSRFSNSIPSGGNVLQRLYSERAVATNFLAMQLVVERQSPVPFLCATTGIRTRDKPKPVANVGVWERLMGA